MDEQFWAIPICWVLYKIMDRAWSLVRQQLMKLVDLFTRLLKLDPENDFRKGNKLKDIQKMDNTTRVGVIDVKAGSGAFKIDKHSLEAQRNIQFEHQNGNVVIECSKVCAPLVRVGGTGSGQTEISGSVLKSLGAQVQSTGDAKITITGNAQMSLS